MAEIGMMVSSLGSFAPLPPPLLVAVVVGGEATLSPLCGPQSPVAESLDEAFCNWCRAGHCHQVWQCVGNRCA